MLDRQQFVEKFDPVFAGFLREKLDTAIGQTHDSNLTAMFEHTYQLFGLRGKRFRPYALHLMYHSAGGEADADAIAGGIGIELQHAFALIHDDIIDRGDIRHGIATTHEFLKRRLTEAGLSPKSAAYHADAQAMLLGDLMLAWSYSALDGVETPSKYRALQLLQDMTAQLIIGEMIDVSFPLKPAVSDDDLAARDALKTSAYTFMYPLLIGATLAGAEQRYVSFCQAFGAAMGEVYQIHDDILDIIGEVGTPTHSDITEHQHTCLTQYALTHGTDSDKRQLEKFFAGGEADAENEKNVLVIVSQPAVIEGVKKKANRLLATAKQAVLDADFTEPHKKQWLDMIAFFEARFD